jgi:hypothetical protein
MRGHFRNATILPMPFDSIFFELCSPCWGKAVIAGAIVENGSSPARSAGNTTWSQGLALGVNGPIPVIVADQFGYPTRASKIAVIRDPKVGYGNAAHISRRARNMPWSISQPARLPNRALQLLGMAALRMAYQETKPGGLISRMSQPPEPRQSLILTRECAPPNFGSTMGFTEIS